MYLKSTHNVWLWVRNIFNLFELNSRCPFFPHAVWQCTGDLTANLGIIMYESYVYKKYKLRDISVEITSLLILGTRDYHNFSHLLMALYNTVLVQHFFVIFWMCKFDMFISLWWVDTVDVWRILAWSDFPLVNSLTFWRINGVTSFPVIPLELKQIRGKKTWSK